MTLLLHITNVLHLQEDFQTSFCFVILELKKNPSSRNRKITTIANKSNLKIKEERQFSNQRPPGLCHLTSWSYSSCQRKQ